MSTVSDGLASALLGVYARPDIVFVSGSGAYLEAEDGRSYLDFTSGIGVNALGHGAEVVAGAIRSALESGLIHTSNLFRTAPGEELAALLVEHAFPGRVFFANSGAESVEAALKFARRWAVSVGGPGKNEVVAFHGGFHGRLFGSLAITDRPAYQEPFRPLMPGARFATLGDVEGLSALVSEESTAAVIVEPVQGEGGVHAVDPAFLADVRALTAERRVALIFDEVQCGLGRTGTLFAFERAAVRPDLLTLAKPIAGGLPMGAVVLSEQIADTIRPGDHATTFGGGPLVASVALAVLHTIGRPEFLAEVRRLGAIVEAWAGSAIHRPGVRAIRGAGLLWGVELEGPAGAVVNAARDGGLLVLSAGPNVVRLMPPLSIDEGDLRHGLGLLDASLT